MLFISEPSEVTWLEAVRMTSSHYMPRQLCSHEPGCYPLATVHFRVSFIIEESEGKFFFFADCRRWLHQISSGIPKLSYNCNLTTVA